MRVSEIRVNQIRVNQGLGVLSKTASFQKVLVEMQQSKVEI